MIANYKQIERAYKFNYMMCSRLSEECEAFFNVPGDCRFQNEYFLYGSTIKYNIKELKRLYNKIPYHLRPQWLSETKIKYFAKKAKLDYSLL